MEKQSSFTRHIGQKLGKKIDKKLGKQTRHQGEAIGQKFDLRVEQLTETVTTAAETAVQSAVQTAKTGLDQILLNLEHRGLNLKDSQDIVHKMSQTVLERAEKIRTQIAEHPTIAPLAPSWMKEPLTKTPPEEGAKATAEASGSMTEASVSEPAQDMQTPTLHDEMLEDGVAAKPARKATKKAKAKSGKTSK